MRAEVLALFPTYVVGAELCSPELAEPLYPEEEAHIARAVEKRRVEFALGRTCARRALAQLGLSGLPLPSQPDRSVAWPADAWGSITHADGYCAAVAARRENVRGLGIDAEVKSRVHRKLWRQIASDHEMAWLEAAEDEARTMVRAALLFSAKETFYKAQFCLTRSWVGFHDVQFSADERGSFEIRLMVPVVDMLQPGTCFSGRYVELPDHVVTGMVLLT